MYKSDSVSQKDSVFSAAETDGRANAGKRLVTKLGKTRNHRVSTISGKIDFYNSISRKRRSQKKTKRLQRTIGGSIYPAIVQRSLTSVFKRMIIAEDANSFVVTTIVASLVAMPHDTTFAVNFATAGHNNNSSSILEHSGMLYMHTEQQNVKGISSLAPDLISDIKISKGSVSLKKNSKVGLKHTFHHYRKETLYTKAPHNKSTEGGGKLEENISLGLIKKDSKIAAGLKTIDHLAKGSALDRSIVVKFNRGSYGKVKLPPSRIWIH